MNALDYKYDSNASILSIHDSPNYASELLNIENSLLETPWLIFLIFLVDYRLFQLCHDENK